MRKNIFREFIVLLSVVFFFTNTVFADEVIPEVIPEPILTPLVESVFIRNGENIVYDRDINLPKEGIVNIIDNNGENHEISSRSVLALIYSISQEVDAPFIISNLQYYPSMNSFYLKCITPKDGTLLCDNWQYVVNGITPWTGIDQTILEGNESIGLYFGTPHKLDLNKNEIHEKQSVIVNSFKYNYVNNIWEILTDVSISVTIPNEEDLWNPIIISETKVDENGFATINIQDTGTYTFGIKEDYSFPSYQVTVKKQSTSSGGSSVVSAIDGDISESKNFSIENAINFLLINQKEDGSFDDSLYTDWVTVGIAKGGEVAEPLKEKILNFLKNENFESSVVTDNERHAMALMAIGIDPYKGTDINYIDKIISSYDEIQIGDPSLYNDDIFGLIVLSHAGYDKNDEMIKNISSYIIKNQELDGSWRSVDMTAAAIQALSNFKNLSGVKDSIAKGELFLQSKQNEDGGFENSFSTSWAIQALSLNNSFEREVEEGIKYLTNQQQIDGGLEGGDINNRIWATSYGIPAILKLSWNDILESFYKEEVNIESLSETVEELPGEIKPVEIIIEKKETNLIDKNIPETKSVKTVKTKEIKITIERSPTEEVKNNLLTASVVQLNQDSNETQSSFISKIVNLIKSSFLWFWVNLVYLL